MKPVSPRPYGLRHLLALVFLVLGTAGGGTVGVSTAGCQVAPAATPDHGAFLYSNYCFQCHEDGGKGKESIGAPSIAGLPEYYTIEQIHKFRTGDRGAHFDDAEGLRMRPMSKTLKTETDIQAVAKYLAALPPARPAPTVAGGDAEKGKQLYATCAACHGPQAAGMEAVGSPPLTLQPDWYLVRQVGKFRAGVRGADPDDVRGGQMRPMALTLPDEQAIKDVIAYVSVLAATPH